MRSRSRRGFSTIEVLIALVIFSVGVLGTLGAMALAWRADLAGETMAAAARVAGSVLDSLRGTVASAGGSCASLSAGRDSSNRVEVDWLLRPTRGGQEITLVLSWPLPQAQSSDTAWSFLPCE